MFLCSAKKLKKKVALSFILPGNPTLPSCTSGRIIMSSWLLCLLVITATYTGNLVAFLTVTKVPVPFDSLKELVEQKQYKYGILGGTNWVTQFRVSGNNVTRS